MSVRRYPLWLKALLIVLSVHTAFVYIEVLPQHTSVRQNCQCPSSHNREISEKGLMESHPPQSQLPLHERRVNEIVTHYDTYLDAKLNELIARQAGARDPELIDLVRALMDPPSMHMRKTSKRIFHTPQSKVVTQVLRNMKNGFFIECGALDGERASNTMALEQEMNWRGVLIEMDPYFYTQIRGKNRKSHSINACLSPNDYPINMEFQESSGQMGKLLDEKEKETKKGTKVPCFPLESILLALNTTKVDFFSLDVEGYELEILKTIPFDRLDITTFAVEYLHGRSGKQAYRDFMESNGYITHKDIHHHEPKRELYVDDFIFIKKGILPAK